MTDSTDRDVAYIRKIAELLDDTGLAEISVRRSFSDGGFLSLRLVSHAAGPATAPQIAAAAPAAPQPAVAEESAKPPAESSGAGSGTVVPSPMIGTIYLAPQPGADPFVRPGDRVAKGQTLLIVEAMKTLNQIPSPTDGVVREVLVTDGEPVEYGSSLVVLA